MFESLQQNFKKTSSSYSESIITVSNIQPAMRPEPCAYGLHLKCTNSH